MALQAKKNGMSAIVLEKGGFVNAIQNFPRDMIFFSTLEQLEIGDVTFDLGSSEDRSFAHAVVQKGIYRFKKGFRALTNSSAWRNAANPTTSTGQPLTTASSKSLLRKTAGLMRSMVEGLPSPHPTRLETVEYYRKVAEMYKIEFKRDYEVVSVKRASNAEHCFEVEVRNRLASDVILVPADRVVIATGFFDNPNMLGVAGETLPNVSHYYDAGDIHSGKPVVVIGGNNSAVDAAMDLHANGAEVTLVHRGGTFSKDVKPWVRPQIDALINHGKIAALFNARVVEIREDSVDIDREGTRQTLASDFVYAMIGYHPDVSFLRGMGIEVNDKTGIPNHNPETFETNVPGIYVAGAITAGYDCDKVFIENGREHGKAIVKSLVA